LRRLQSAPDVSDEDKASIAELVEHLLVKGISKQRSVKYINHLIVLARVAGCVLGKLDRKGVEALVGRINAANYTEHTKHDYKIILKKYFQWLRKCDEEEQEYPEEVRWIKTHFKKKRLVPEALISPEEVARLSKAAENPRDKAFILTHYDGGFRIGETLSMKVLNVEFDKYSAIVRVDGKTGPRRVRLTISTPALASWLSVHPFRNDPESSLWIGVGTVGRNKPLSYAGARALLRRLAKKTGLKKRIYTRLMRHSRATELATILTEAQMKEHFGWVPGSDMPSTYVHLSGRDVDGAILKAHGITVDQESNSRAAITLIKCRRCAKDITSEDQFCPACGMVLNAKTAIQLEDERMKADRLMDLLMQGASVNETNNQLEVTVIQNSSQVQSGYVTKNAYNIQGLTASIEVTEFNA
jgi:integrase/recombinase XerD